MFGRLSVEKKMTSSSLTGAAVLPIIFPFHILSLDMAILRKQSRKPTVIAYVETVHMRLLILQRNV